MAPVEDYLYSLLPARDEVLTEIEAKRQRTKFPSSGRPWRASLSTGLDDHAKTVFEMGSAIGYSTIWWARAVGEGGRVIYTDGDRKKADEARRYFERAGVADRITLKTGDALELLSEQKDNSTSSLMTSTRRLSPGLEAGGARCEQVGCLSPTTSCGVGG